MTLPAVAVHTAENGIAALHYRTPVDVVRLDGGGDDERRRCGRGGAAGGGRISSSPGPSTGRHCSRAWTTRSRSFRRGRLTARCRCNRTPEGPGTSRLTSRAPPAVPAVGWSPLPGATATTAASAPGGAAGEAAGAGAAGRAGDGTRAGDGARLQRAGEGGDREYEHIGGMLLANHGVLVFARTVDGAAPRSVAISSGRAGPGGGTTRAGAAAG